MSFIRLRKITQDLLLCCAITLDSVTLIDLSFKILSHSTEIKENFFEKTLILACFKGRPNVVKHLVQKYEVDVNQRYAVWPDIRGGNANGTALHAAVRSGNVQLVEYLLKTCNVDINATTRKVLPSWNEHGGGSTALHLAVLHLEGWKRCEMVSCLLTNGADWNICDDSGKQCWELTSGVNLTKLMISFGVGLNSSMNSTLSNIAHKWAKSNDERSSEVVHFAINQGVDLNLPDERGLTPLMVAGFGHNAEPNENVFKLILELCKNEISLLDKILAYELIGACFIVWEKKVKGLQYWKKALELRFGVQPPIPKSKTPGSSRLVFRNVSEVQTLQELKALENLLFSQSTTLILHSFLTCIRILGPNHSETLELFSKSFATLWETDKQKYLDCSMFMLENFNLMSNGSWKSCRAVIFVYIFTLFQSNNDPSLTCALKTFDNTMRMLRILVGTLKQMNGPPVRCEKQEDKITDILISILFLIDLMVGSVKLSSSEGLKLKCCLHEVVRLKTKDKTGCDLLLMACIPLSFRCFTLNLAFQKITAHRYSIRRSLSADVISLLLEVGADPNSACNEGNTGLHLLARYNETFDSDTIRVLNKAGTHIDRKNVQGETAADLMKTDPPEIPFLQCLCARVVDKSKESLFEGLPPNIIEFINIH